MKFKRILKYFITTLGIILLGLLIFYGLFLLFTNPSNNRDWTRDMKVLSEATITEDQVIIENVRNNKYKSTTDFDVEYYQGKYELSKLKKVYLITDPFGKLASHTMLSYEFSDGQRVVMSVEIRKEIGEVFENFKGLFRGYELYYVWADEKDVIKLRTNYRLDNVYMYELDMAEENVQKLFIEALHRTNQLKKTPEFYNLLVNNCTTNIAKMLQVVYDKPIIVDWRYLAPAYAEGLSMKYGLIKGTSIEDVRKNHNISPDALKCGDCNQYSDSIRKSI